MEALEVIGEVQWYWEALYAKRPVSLPAFEMLTGPISLGVYHMNGGRYRTTPYRTSRTP